MLTHEEIFKRTISLFTGETQGLKVAESGHYCTHFSIIDQMSVPAQNHASSNIKRPRTNTIPKHGIQVNNVRDSKLWTSTLGL